jgi:uncharacterized protein YukE
MEVKANYQVLQDLADLIRLTGSKIQQERTDWGTKTSQTEADWMDTAGGAFGALSRQWDSHVELQETVLVRLQGAVNDAIRIYMEHKARAESVVRDV